MKRWEVIWFSVLGVTGLGCQLANLYLVTFR